MVDTVRGRLVPASPALLLACASTPPPPHLTADQDRQLQALLRENEDLFATDEHPFGRTHLVEHIIETGSARPIHQGLRPSSPSERAVVRGEVRKMLESGAIRPSTSPWASPTVMVTKKDGSVRFCVDFKKLNDVTKKDVFPLPRISDLLESLASARYFTLLDAASGYWQIPVAAEDIEKTAFITADGLFEFVVMPFGLCNAPATYQRLMNQLLGGLTWKSCHVYIDDILVFSPTFESHLQHVRDVFDRMRTARMLLKRKKCSFAQVETHYLGNVVSAQGVAPDPAKVEKLRSFPAPRDKKEVRSFLGLAGYYRRFVKHYAARAGPLFDLLKDDTPFVWGEEQKKCFDEVIGSIASDALLPHPRFDLPFILDTDASDTGLGAVLSQVVDGRERPLAFASRRLQPAERKWAIREKEALGIIWGLETYRHFLLGSKFQVRTDHSSLTVIKSAKTGRLARWGLRLAEFGEFEIAHRAGLKHSNVDAFTRLPESDTVPDHATFLVSKAEELPQRWTMEELRQHQLEDAWCKKEAEAYATGQRPLYKRVDGILCLEDPRHHGPPRILLPERLRPQIVSAAHELGHLGVKRIQTLLNERYVWPRMVDWVKEVVTNCLPCRRRKPPLPQAGVMSSSPPSFPWDVVAMDFCGPYVVSTRGNRYILVFVDQFTKMVELCPCSDQLSSTVSQCFYDRII